MPAAEFELWIEDEHCVGEWPPADNNTDVNVTLADGSRWVATFFSFDNVATLRRNYAKSGECLGGKYFWASDMVLIDDTSRVSIESVVRDLLSSGEFQSAFSAVPEDDAHDDASS